ncbi:MAG: 1,6-anhydro-N-acetylmuramyl-L-alanine amidase AmpD [Rhodocyclaceae bacterium]|nr:1,6-anhydro-N-acetylmuramyl-L-alanine amidase AmpD [Rhodocyclaceae bacterium]
MRRETGRSEFIPTGTCSESNTGILGNVGLKPDLQGWLEGARRVVSPNCDERPGAEVPSLIVIHAISLPPGEFGGDAIERLFTNRLDPDAHPFFREIEGLRVSAHFLIRRDGELIQFVPCALRAWHAGVSTWNGRSRCNDFSLGVELEGCDDLPFENIQYQALAGLLARLRQTYPLEHMVGHSDIAPGRKTDPGPSFDWDLLKRLTGASAPGIAGRDHL